MKTNPPAGEAETIYRSAEISKNGLWRYSLLRTWRRPVGPRLLFVMLNPSTADAEKDDPTITRCIRRARDNLYGSVEVVNLFAFRATKPEDLKKASDPIGPANDFSILEAADQASAIVAAWGRHGDFLSRGLEVENLLKGRLLYCLGVTKDGHPRHPLYIKADQTILPLRRARGES